MAVGDAGSGGSEGEWAFALRGLTQIAQITQMSCTPWISQIFPITIGHQGCFGIEKNLRDRGYNIICEICGICVNKNSADIFEVRGICVKQ